MSYFMPVGLIAAPAPPPGQPPRVAGTFRGTMTPKGEADPDGGADYPRFDNEHGAEVREILATTGDYLAGFEEDRPRLELPPITIEYF